jgi:hypothetical protein
MIEAARRASGIILDRQLTHIDDDLANFEQIWRKLRDGSPFWAREQHQASCTAQTMSDGGPSFAFSFRNGLGGGAA